MRCHPWWDGLAFDFFCSWTVGFLRAIIFQLAHCVDIAEVATSEVPRRGVDFAPHQMATTVDIDAPRPVVAYARH